MKPFETTGGLILFFDEGRFGLQSTVTRVWAKRGEPLHVKVQQGYKSFYIYSCVSPHSGESFSLFLPEVNTEMMNIFLEGLTKEYPGRDITIILDQAGWHKAKGLKVSRNISLLFFPPYSPELNPVEKLWQWLRKEVSHNAVFKTIPALMDALEKEFRNLTPLHFSQLCHCTYL
ncbi:MAG: IS630 family transposase [Pseudomonadota bacterium]